MKVVPPTFGRSSQRSVINTSKKKIYEKNLGDRNVFTYVTKNDSLMKKSTVTERPVTPR